MQGRSACSATTLSPAGFTRLGSVHYRRLLEHALEQRWLTVCIGIALGLTDLVGFFRRRKTGKLRWLAIGFVVLVIVLHLVSFYILSPVFNYDYSWFLKAII